MGLPLFDGSAPDVDIKGMVHRGDPAPASEAATVIAQRRTELHEKVLRAFERYGPMTDAELEELSEFSLYGPSTIRKRRSELFQQKELVMDGERANSRGRMMTVWALR